VSGSSHAAHVDGQTARQVLRQAGWVENREKAQGPAQRLTFLGLDIDTRTLSVHIPHEKKQDIVNNLRQASSVPRGSVRALARLVGRALSCLLATGPTLILLARNLMVPIFSTSSYDKIISWKSLQGDFNVLAEALVELDGASIAHMDDIDTSTVQLASDASAVGYAVCEIICGQGRQHVQHAGPCGREWIRGELTHIQRDLSSTHRELVAILALLVKKGHELKGHRITNWTDSVNAERVIARGSSKPQLQHLALMIHRLARHFNVSLRVVWTRRTDPRIKIADELSRGDIADLDDFGLSAPDFLQLEIVQQGFDFDLFATERNTRCPSYAAIRRDRWAAFRDAFSIPNWQTLGKVYAHPPPSAVAATITKLVRDGATGVLIVPRWYTLKGWHLICRDGRHVNGWVTRVKKFYPSYVSGPSVQSKTFQGTPSFPSLALWFQKPQIVGAYESIISPIRCVDEKCTKCHE